MQDIDLLCIATAASTKPRLTMVQIVPRCPDLDAPANATEHKTICVKPWVSSPPPYPLSRAVENRFCRDGKFCRRRLADFQSGPRHADIQIDKRKPL
jgi:hypothetical protein